MTFRSSQELESDANFVSLPENLGLALGAFKSINLPWFVRLCFLRKNQIIHNFCKGEIDTKFSESFRTSL